jgi:glycosyltransferase involved in cell wall biosynthesis
VRKPPVLEISSKISVIIAVLNSAEMLQRALDSVKAQTWRNKELIVMDGGSTDGSVEIIRANEDSVAYWESNPDRGIYHAWNKALDHASGDWIHFMGADDYFMDSEVLANVAGSLASCAQEVKIAYGKMAVVSRTGEVLEIKGEPWEVSRERFRKVMTIPHPALFTHRELFEIHGKFDESFRSAGDYELLLRELPGGHAMFIPDVIVKGMIYGGTSTSPSRILTGAIEIAKAKKLNGIWPYDLVWLWILAQAVVKYCFFKLLGDRATRSVVDLYRRATGRPAVWTQP